MIEKAYKYRIYPDEEQKIALAKTFGSCRFVYNHFLNAKQTQWKENREALNYTQISTLLKELKNQLLWLKEVSSVCLQQALRHLDKAYQAFFQKKAKYPKFKSKSDRQSAHYMKNAFTWKSGQITLAKMKNPLNVKWSREFKGEPTSLTISKDPSDRYFISILVKEEVESLPFVKKTIAIDLGLQHLLIDQNGLKQKNPRFLKRCQKRIKQLQQKLSKKKKGSNNRNKAKKNLAILHQKIRDQRHDFLHKLSSKIINENQVIISEDLNVKKMQKKSRLAFSIADASWSTLLAMIKYKATWYGRDFVQVSTFFPSSRLCSSCGEKAEQMPLHIRKWACSSCYKEHDRDENAAKNLLKEGVKLIRTAGHAGSYKPVELV